MPGRGSIGGSPSREVMREGGASLPPLGPPRSGPSGLTGGGEGRGRSIGTNTPPTMTAAGGAGKLRAERGTCDMGGGGGRGIGGGELKKGEGGGGGCWWRCEGGGVWRFSPW